MSTTHLYIFFVIMRVYRTGGEWGRVAVRSLAQYGTQRGRSVRTVELRKIMRGEEGLGEGCVARARGISEDFLRF